MLFIIIADGLVSGVKIPEPLFTKMSYRKISQSHEVTCFIMDFSNSSETWECRQTADKFQGDIKLLMPYLVALRFHVIFGRDFRLVSE